MVLCTPIALLVAYYISSQSHWDLKLTNGSWGAAGALLVTSFKLMMRSLQEAQSATDVADTKIFNEQIKLLATTINYVALGLFAGALLQPLTVESSGYGLLNFVLLLLGVYIHSVSQQVLFLMKRE
jgi:hypothetical protein